MAYNQHSPEFKSKVALAAIKGDKTLPELSQEFGIHPNQISRWKQLAIKNFSKIFEKDNQASQELKEKDRELEVALKKLGQLTVESEWIKKKLKPYL